MSIKRKFFGALVVLSSLFLPVSAMAQEVLPRPDQPFKGKIERLAKDSKPDFPQPFQAPKDSPNVLLIMTDDVGFGASSPFGGPISTPTLDMLAKRGLRYTQFHTTALCSPTRAALITGRNHHSNATGVIMELGTGYPGYNSLMSKANGTIAEVLKQNGYSTAWFGKNHNIPDWQNSQAGPFDLWPTGLGFEYFYGFIGGDADQWSTPIYEGTKPIQAAEQQGKNPMHFDQLMADKAITWIRTQNAMAPDKPFFAYYTPGTAHAPHHAPKDWIAKFKGQFDQGWDKVREETFARQKKMGIIPADAVLTPRPKEIPAWDSLSADQKRLFSRMMEVYAAALAHADYQIGRVIQSVADMGKLDNTMILFIQGDNGASAEGSLQGMSNEGGVAFNGAPESLEYLLSQIDNLGGPLTYNHYPVGWAHAMNTPFQWAKQVASHFGGTRNGLVISWPETIKDQGAIRPQFHHVIDVLPTILQAAHVPFPKEINGVKQKPVEGKSMLYTFDDPKAPSHRTTQYFEMMANRAIYHDGWVAATTPLRLPWVLIGSEPSPDDFKWELYNINKDFTQSNNLAESNPGKLKELQAVFDKEAKKYNVYPLDSSAAARLNPAIRPSLTRGRTSFTYYAGMIRIPDGSAPDTKNTSYTITADVDLSDSDASGILATQGGRFGGWALLLDDGTPEFAYALSNQPQHKTRIVSDSSLSSGKHTIQFNFVYDGGGRGKGGVGTLLIDGKKVAEKRIERTIPNRISMDETLDIGEDTGTPVVEDYADAMPFRFTGGALEKVTIDLK
ncbi:MAG: arylsulfatase [bacterium]